MTETEQNLPTSIFIQPKKLATKQGQLRYHWDIAEFTRLDGLLYNDEGKIELVLNGRFDDRQRCLVDAHIKAKVQLQCQTTFEPIDYEIVTQITYCSVIKEEQIETLEDDYEALLLEDGQVDIRRVIEDELILSLPIVANKASGDTSVKFSYGELPQQKPQDKNPFAALKDLKLH